MCDVQIAKKTRAKTYFSRSPPENNNNDKVSSSKSSNKKNDTMNKPTQTQTRTSSSLISPDCCFISNCMDMDEIDIGASFRYLTGYGQAATTEKEADLNRDSTNTADTARTSTTSVSSSSSPSRKSNTNNNNSNKMSMSSIRENSFRKSNVSRTRKQKLKSKLSSSSEHSHSHSHPPPVIALSRSSFSNGSNSSANSALESTEVDNIKVKSGAAPAPSISISRRIGMSMGLSGINMNMNMGNATASGTVGNLNSTGTGTNRDHDGDHETSNERQHYEALHELLINTLFEDAKSRQEHVLLIQQQQELQNQQKEEDRILTSDSEQNIVFFNTPPRNDRKNSNGRVTPSPSPTPQSSASLSDNKSIASRTSKYSHGSRSSGLSRQSSELLTPSSHRFKSTLKTSRRRAVLPNLIRRRKPSKFDKYGCSSGNGSGKKNKGVTNSLSPYSHSPTDFSACSASMTTSSQNTPPRLPYTSSPSSSSFTSSHHQNNLQRFLDKNVKLQKDSGKGDEPGTNISAEGRDDAIQKLNDKMDVLAEVERDGIWSNAVLTRVPAMDVTKALKDLGLWEKHQQELEEQQLQQQQQQLQQQKQKQSPKHKQQKQPPQPKLLPQRDYVETRSMLSIKVGFMTLKYGILVHWNINTGLAELILLRKNCPGSFMKIVPPHSNNGSPKKKLSKISWRKKMRRMSSSYSNSVPAATTMMAPSLVSVSSEQSDDQSYGSLGLDPIQSAPL